MHIGRVKNGAHQQVGHAACHRELHHLFFVVVVGGHGESLHEMLLGRFLNIAFIVFYWGANDSAASKMEPSKGSPLSF